VSAVSLAGLRVLLVDDEEILREATAEALQHLLQRAEDQGLDGEAFLTIGEVPWNKV